MTTSATIVQKLDRGAGCFVDADRGAVLMEVMETTSQDVWMTITPVTKVDFKALTGLPEGFTPTGCATPAYDCCLFRTPGVHQGPVEIREFAGHRWINVARPLDMKPQATAEGPMRITVGKDHVLGYDGGRTLTVMSLEGEDFVEVVGTGRDDAKLTLPEGAALRTITIGRPLAVELPAPATTWFWTVKNIEIRSFQGPVSLPTVI